MQPLLANPAYTPQPANIAATAAAFQEFLRIRSSSELFRMDNLADVEKNLTFLNTGQNQIPGLIAMKLDKNSGRYGGYSHLLVVFNAADTATQLIDASLKGLHMRLHPILESSSDPVVRQAAFNGQQGSVSVPALTTAVFVQ